MDKFDYTEILAARQRGADRAAEAMAVRYKELTPKEINNDHLRKREVLRLKNSIVYGFGFSILVGSLVGLASPVAGAFCALGIGMMIVGGAFNRANEKIWSIEDGIK